MRGPGGAALRVTGPHAPCGRPLSGRATLGNAEADVFDSISAVRTGPIASEPTRKEPAYLAMGQEVTR